jgi:hypothetical protein
VKEYGESKWPVENYNLIFSKKYIDYGGKKHEEGVDYRSRRKGFSEL